MTPVPDAGTDPAGELATRQTNVPWGLGAAVGALVVAFGIYFLAGGITLYAFPQAFSGSRATQEAFGIIDYQFLLLGTVVAALVFVVIPTHSGPRALGFRFPGWRTLAIAALSVIPILIALGLLSQGFDKLFPNYHLQGNTQELLPGRGHVGLFEKAVILLWVSVEAPFVEETLFRGIAFQGIRRLGTRFAPYPLAVAFAAIVSGAAFGLAHAEPRSFPILAALGVILAYVFQTGRSIYASMVVHGTINALATLSVLSSM
ncbi:MAG TPA: type II CAAX endopeptidase family protein [Chloroflexota bacterium]|nr:type II CAAX endopeptidase family protein [Chloroflexota bacterium]